MYYWARITSWDLWTDLSNKKYHQLTKVEKEFLDELADILSTPDFEKDMVDAMIQRLPADYLASIYSQLKISKLTNEEVTVDPYVLHEKFQIESIFDTENIEHTQKDDSVIYLKGARENNLKNIEVTIPKNRLTVVTGVSGSGKSSLVFDTIYQEGKRRYFENANNGAKLNEQIAKPDFDVLQGLTPTISIEQKKGNQNPRSTIGTMSGIWDYLRMLYVSVGKTYCPYCAKELVSKSKTKNGCPTCSTLFPKLNTSMLNANTHTGACSECNGLGYTYKIDPTRIVQDSTKSILDGATNYWGKLRGKKLTGNWMVGELYAIAKEENINLDTPWNELPTSFIQRILYGSKDKIYTYEYESKGRIAKIKRPASGAVHHIQRLFREAMSNDTPYLQYMKKHRCHSCNGELLSIEARFTSIYGFRFPDLTKLTIRELSNWIQTLPKYLNNREQELSRELLYELTTRTNNLMKVGLHYLSSDRTAPTLSGGELQRVRLSNQLGSELTGITYIIDEPSIGLHPRDNSFIIQTLRDLVDDGNTVIVVEHDKETMLSADYIIDVGYGAGHAGGTVIASGSVEELMQDKNSITAPYLKSIENYTPQKRRDITKWIELNGCCANNLKNINVKFPLNCICSITGVSGSGKSSLVFESLVPALENSFAEDIQLPQAYQSIEGYQQVSGYVLMNQSSVGKSIRSSVATYTNVFDEIRLLFSKTEQSKTLELDETHFSFNSKKGQCPNCMGIGKIKITLPYMADQWITCSECNGRRFQHPILSVNYQGKNIHEVLEMEVVEAVIFFQDNALLKQKLNVLLDVGLGYLTLGQSTAILSGGESQRLKLAKELGGKIKGNMLYILDEPTTGLHFKDIEKLQVAFNKLVQDGHTVLIIEHASEIVNASDWVIDIGRESGVDGGEVVAIGTPEQIKANRNSITGRYL